MAPTTWLQRYCMMIAIISWIPDVRIGVVLASSTQQGFKGRTKLRLSTRGRRTLNPRLVTTKRNNSCPTNSIIEGCCIESSIPRVLSERLRGGASDPNDPDPYYNEASSFRDYDERQDYSYETSPRRRRQQQEQEQRYDNDEYYYGEPSNDDRYPYDNDPYYDDRGRPPPRSATSTFSPSTSSNAVLRRFQNMLQQGDRQIGLVLLGSGLFFTMMGITLFFQKALMRLGNLLFIAGVPVTIGPGRTAGYFFQPQKARATGCLAVGIFLVFFGMPVVGMVLELFGLLNLFGNLFPVIFAIVKQMPIVGNILGNSNNSNKPYNNNRSRDRYSYDDDNQYYDDQRYGSGGGEDPDDGGDGYPGADRYY